jgi:hypothetical protein
LFTANKGVTAKIPYAKDKKTSINNFLPFLVLRLISYTDSIPSKGRGFPFFAVYKPIRGPCHFSTMRTEVFFPYDKVIDAWNSHQSSAEA